MWEFDVLNFFNYLFSLSAAKRLLFFILTNYFSTKIPIYWLRCGKWSSICYTQCHYYANSFVLALPAIRHWHLTGHFDCLQKWLACSQKTYVGLTTQSGLSVEVDSSQCRYQVDCMWLSGNRQLKHQYSVWLFSLSG